MSRRRMDDQGASEIVATLMLIVIVSVAATGISAFVAQQQKETQAQKALQLAKSLERLDVLEVEPTLDADPTKWLSLKFTLVNNHAASSSLLGFVLNDEPAASASVERFNRTAEVWDTSTWTSAEELRVLPMERFYVTLDLTVNFATAQTVLIQDPIQFEFFSARLNHFTRDFLPPTAIALLQVETGSPADTIILDGTQSDHADPAARIVRWEWTVDDGTPPDDVLVGRKVQGFTCDGQPRDITLEITDNFGLFASSTITAYSC